MAVSERKRAGKALPVAGRYTLTVGVHAADGDAQHDTRSPRVDLSISELATIHEFGLGAPQRSFIRAWFDEQQDSIQSTLKSQVALAQAGKIPIQAALERCALAFEGAMKKRIARGIPPPNAASTIARKGSSKPLIDTGQLRNAIRGRVGQDGQ